MFIQSTLKKSVIAFICLIAMQGQGFTQAYNERIEQQELELRRLTGEVETLKYENMRLNKEFDSMKKQMNLRFEMLEGGDSFTPPVGAVGAVGADNTDPSRNQATENKNILTVSPNNTAKNLYDTAKMDFDKRLYSESATGFEQFVQKYPKDPLTPNAYYWLGESIYAKGDYNKAALMFLEGKRKFPQSQKAGHSLYKLGMSLQMLGENKEACLTFDEVQKTYLPKDASLNALLAKGRQTAKCL